MPSTLTSTSSRSQANTLVVAGNTFFERVINALDDLGVDINHPGQVMAMLKAIGAEQLEINFGARQEGRQRDARPCPRVAHQHHRQDQ